MPWSMENCDCDVKEGRPFDELKPLESTLEKEGSAETDDDTKPCRGAWAGGVKLNESNCRAKGSRPADSESCASP